MIRITLSLLALLVAAPTAHAAAWWQRPVDGAVLRAFGVGADPYARGQHRGVDLGAALSAPVRSACGGRVVFAGRVPRGGLTVSVRCEALVATYQQLGALAVRAGQRIERGRRLGAVGRSSDPHTRRPHLHLGARETATGRYVDPLMLLRGAPAAVPLLAPEQRGRPRAAPLGPGPAPTSPRAAPVGRAPASPRAAPVRRAPAPVAPRVAPLPLGHSPSRPPTFVRPAAPSSSRPPTFVRPAAPSSRPASDLAGDSPAGATPPPIPWLVWVGLAAFGLALPIGGFARFGGPRRAARSHATANANGG